MPVCIAQAAIEDSDKNISEYHQEIPQSHAADQPTASRGRNTEHSHRETIKVKQLFLSEMIAKLERTLRTVLQNKGQTYKLYEQ